MHHCLLHKQNTVESRSPVTDHAEIRHLENNDFSKNSRAEQGNVSTNRATFFTEGNDTAHKATMVAQNRTKPPFIGLRTVPVILLNKDRSLRVNALLDDASTKTYLNANIAKELGLQGRTEKVNVSVLNGHVEALMTKSIDVILHNVTGNVSMKLNAYTVNKVTGDMPVVDWNHYKEQWPHLGNIDFPLSTKRPIVDILIGLDCADLLYAIEERQGKPGDPIARLTLLGWTCIGNLDSYDNTILQTNFAYANFLKERPSEIFESWESAEQRNGSKSRQKFHSRKNSQREQPQKKMFQSKKFASHKRFESSQWFQSKEGKHESKKRSRGQYRG